MDVFLLRCWNANHKNDCDWATRATSSPGFPEKDNQNVFKLIELSKNNKKELKFIIETHSETIVNYLGKLIYNKSVSKDDINLLVCEKVDNKSIFERMIFNDEGYIENWPIGFFSDEE